MFLIDTSRQGQVVTDAVVNQSIDNYLVNDLKLPRHGLMMYVNQPAVIVGINQTVAAEVDFSLFSSASRAASSANIWRWGRVS